jgi:hypothetical protein
LHCNLSLEFVMIFLETSKILKASASGNVLMQGPAVGALRTIIFCMASAEMSGGSGRLADRRQAAAGGQGARG